MVRKAPCPRCRAKGDDNSGDNLVIYKDDSSHCFACGYTVQSKEYEAGEEKEVEDDIQTSKKVITDETKEYIKRRSTYAGRGFRKIHDTYNKFFGVLTQYDEETGEQVYRYYPVTKKNELVGYSRRTIEDKDFRAIGKNGKDCDLDGQFRFKGGGKYLLIVGGQEDKLAAFQMLREDQKARGKDSMEPIPVVSPTIGEKSAAQLATHYEWLDSFERIILGFDMDDAGREATEKAVKVLPKGKVYVAEWPDKDPSDCLVNGKEKEFISAFYKAKKYSPAGILTSAGLHEKIIERALTPKIPLPPFMKKLQKMMAGGIPLGYIVNFLAASGIGKTTLVNELIYFWIFNSEYPIGIVSLEADAGEYGENLLSRHLGRKLSLIEDIEEKVSYLKREDIQQLSEQLWLKAVRDEEGMLNYEPRFFLVDDRGDLESIQAKVEHLVVGCGCKIIVIDPLQDALAGFTNEQTELYFKWMKEMVRSHNVTFININHSRKNGNGQTANSRGAELSEEDIHGASVIFKSGGANIIMMRDKHSEDEITRNTTRITASKIRWTGVTGPAGEAFYDNPTHTLWDKEEWLEQHTPSY